MSLREKMENAKEVDMFPELSQDEKIEAIVEGKVQIALIKELEKIKAEICQRCNDALFGSVSGIVDKNISELKGDTEKEYKAEVITRGNCMMCGKELTEGLFFCKECENKAKERTNNEQNFNNNL